WYEDWVGGIPDHAAYLERLGASRRSELVFPAPPGTAAAGKTPSPEDLDAAPSEQEQLIVLGARAVADLVRERG
ncbi:acetate CoA-transferase, partial [Streptomyces sp. SID10362]|nr:acetate CoA-transferase [Streptomyces sp. SID10362]